MMTNNPVKILVIDDEPDMLWSLNQILSYANYTVVMALNGGEALNYLRKHAFAVAIVDVKLPDMDGLQLATMLKAITPELAIVLISGYYYAEDPEIEREVNQKIATSFISKPFSLRELRSTIQQVLVNLELRYSKLQRVGEKAKEKANHSI